MDDEPVVRMYEYYEPLSISFALDRPVFYDGKPYGSVLWGLAAYRAGDQLHKIEEAKNGRHADGLAARLPVPEGWLENLIGVAADLNVQKFRNEPYKSLLLSTGEAVILHSDRRRRYYDCFEDSNWIGKLLMEIRDAFK